MTSPDQATEIPWDVDTAKARGIYALDSIDPRSRSFNLLRARVLELRRERNWRMFAVLSATPGVGKSFIAANLAAALSRDPRYQTFLVDLDLRRGSLMSIFGINTRSGLRDYLEGVDGLDSPPAYALQGENLVILPTRPGHIHSAELLASEPAQSLMRKMRESDGKNLFVCDLPPVFANDDAATIMASLDAYLLVAEEGKTTQRELEDAVDLLGRQRLAGVVLNKYRGGLVSEGYGVEPHYATNYEQEPA